MCNKVLKLVIILMLILILCYLLSNKINLQENYETSTADDVDEGASQLYHWGYPEDKPKEVQDSVPEPTPQPQDDSCEPKPEPRPYCKTSDNNYALCKNCDITLNKDIDKYVLKSSIKPCPNSSRFATKNMVKPCPDLSNYMLKSECKRNECPPRPDMSKYVLKTEIPACPKLPEIPKCPVCPKPQNCKALDQYRINQHPDFNLYVHKDVYKKEINIHKNKYDKLKKEMDNYKINQQKQQQQNVFTQNCNNQVKMKPFKNCY